MSKINTSRGFTIVELLIVIVVIGILAAIVIVAFNGIQNRATNTSVRSDLAGIHKVLEAARIDTTHGGYPSVAEIATLNNGNLKWSINKDTYESSRNNLYYCRTTDNEHYAVGVHTKNNGYFLVDGVIQEASSASSVYGTQTCARLDPALTGSAVSGLNTANATPWANFIK